MIGSTDADRLFESAGPGEGFEYEELDFTDEGVESTVDAIQQESQVAATYDALVLISRLERQRPPAQVDLHTFAYLACLMSVYNGEPPSEWGYSFSAVPPTLPYSPTLDLATQALLEAEFILTVPSTTDAGHSVFTLTPEGAAELAFFSSLSLLTVRLQYLEAATSAATFTSATAVVNSLAHEPQLAVATKLGSSRRLFTPSSTVRLYEEFEALTRAVGQNGVNLIVPASMYVAYLQSVAVLDIGEGRQGVVSDA